MSNRLLKARDVSRSGAHVAFNFDDLHRQCEEYIQQVTVQAEELMAHAAEQGELLRQQGYTEGYETGCAAGQADADQRVADEAARLADLRTDDRLRSALPALEAAVEALKSEREKWLKVWESAAIRLSAAIAERIIKRQVLRHPELAPELITDALQLAAGSPRFSIRIHPADIEELRQHGQLVLDQLASLGQATLIPDINLSRGGCVIETTHGHIDARLESQVERIVEELLAED